MDTLSIKKEANLLASEELELAQRRGQTDLNIFIYYEW